MPHESIPLLDDEDKANIDAAIESSDSIRENIQRAKSAGLDIGDKEEKLNASVDKLKAIRGAFFPN